MFLVALCCVQLGHEKSVKLVALDDTRKSCRYTYSNVTSHRFGKAELMSTCTSAYWQGNHSHPVQSKINTTTRKRKTEPDSKTSAPVPPFLHHPKTSIRTTIHLERGTYSLIVSVQIHSVSHPKHPAWYPNPLPLLRLS